MPRAFILRPMKFPERMQKARKDAGLTQTELAVKLKLSQGAVQQWEDGTTYPRRSRYQSIADAVGVDPAWLFQESGLTRTLQNRRVQLVGYVGAGAKMFPVENHLRGGLLEEVEAPPIDELNGIVAVRVRGDSLVPVYWDGDIVYYGAHETDPDKLIGKEVVACSDDGEIALRRLARGREPGRYDLVSYSGLLTQDARLQWVARVRWVKRAE